MPLEIVRYAEKNLEPGERIVFQTRTHWITLVKPSVSLGIGFGLLAGATILGMPDHQMLREDPGTAILGSPHILILPVALYFLVQGSLSAFAQLSALKGSEMTITSRRVIHKEGIVWRDADEIHAGKLEGSRLIKQSWLGQMLNYGTLAINGTGGKVITLPSARNPMAFRKNVSRLIAFHENRQRRQPSRKTTKNDD